MKHFREISTRQRRVARRFDRLPAPWSIRSDVGMDFALPPEIKAILERTRAFAADEILPVEQDQSSWDEHESIRLGRLELLRAKAKLTSLRAPRTPPLFGGMGLSRVAMPAMY